MKRSARIERKTKETEIVVSLDLDGSGIADIDTGIGFFDHMLDAFTRHGLFDLSVRVNGDLNVDGHHTVEDTGIVLGTAIKEAVAGKEGMRRYGYSILPMDDALVLCSLDVGGRPYFASDLKFTMAKIGELDTELIREFFYAVTVNADLNLHLKQLDGYNNHHIAEAAFKAFAKALDTATSTDPRIEGVLSTKGKLD